jgi:hypothetical protein
MDGIGLWPFTDITHHTYTHTTHTTHTHHTHALPGLHPAWPPARSTSARPASPGADPAGARRPFARGRPSGCDGFGLEIRKWAGWSLPSATSRARVSTWLVGTGAHCLEGCLFRAWPLTDRQPGWPCHGPRGIEEGRKEALAMYEGKGMRGRGRGKKKQRERPSWHRYGDACLGVDGHRQCAASMDHPGTEWMNGEPVV